MMKTFALTPTTPTTATQPTEQAVHMERFWDDNGPVSMCGIYPPKRDGPTMTDTWDSATCRACLRSKPADGSMKRKYIKLPPELADGQSCTFHRVGEEFEAKTLGESLEQWLDDEDPGASIKLTVVEMTDAEWEALPEI